MKESENYRDEVAGEIISVKYEREKLNREIRIHEQEIESLNDELLRRDAEISSIEKVILDTSSINALQIENNLHLVKDVRFYDDSFRFNCWKS